MKGNKLTAWAIILVTALVPLRLAYFNDGEANMGFKILMMIITMAGAIAAIAVGADKAEAAH